MANNVVPALSNNRTQQLGTCTWELWQIASTLQCC